MPKKSPESPEGQAWCATCQQHLPVDQFYKRGGGREGYVPRCKLCDKTRQDLKRQSKPGWKPLVRSKDAPEGQKWCPHCSTFKPVDEFTIARRTPDGLQSYCKKCIVARRNELTPEQKERYYQSVRRYQIAHRTPIVHKYKFPEGPIAPKDLAYIAGLFDAEGTFGITDGAPSATLYNNNKTLLEYVQSVIGGSILETSRDGWYFYSLVFANQPLVKKLCENLIPFLVLKKRRAQILVEAMDIQRCNRGDLKAELSVLNAKGVSVEPPEQKVPAIQCDLTAVTDCEWAYFAGWIDGDGVLYIQNQGGYCYPRLAVYSTKPAPLFHLHKTFGGKIEWRERDVEGHARSFSLHIDDSKYVEKLLQWLQNFIVGKKEQLEVMLDSMKHQPLYRQAHVEKVSELNQKYRHKKEERDSFRAENEPLFPPEDGAPCVS